MAFKIARFICGMILCIPAIGNLNSQTTVSCMVFQKVGFWGIYKKALIIKYNENQQPVYEKYHNYLEEYEGGPVDNITTYKYIDTLLVEELTIYTDEYDTTKKDSLKHIYSYNTSHQHTKTEIWRKDYQRRGCPESKWKLKKRYIHTYDSTGNQVLSNSKSRIGEWVYNANHLLVQYQESMISIKNDTVILWIDEYEYFDGGYRERTTNFYNGDIDYPIRNREYFFNEKGELTSEKEYLDTGEVWEWISYYYDKKGNLKKTTWKGEKGDLVITHIYSYKYK